LAHATKGVDDEDVVEFAGDIGGFGDEQTLE
jgi:hypothetical protein